MTKPGKKDRLFVGLQLVLFVLYLFRFSIFDLVIHIAVRYTGLVLALIGLIIIAASFLVLRKNLTPFPSPLQNGELVTTGIYKYIRHPIYTGILMLTFGYGLFSQNLLRLIIFLVLGSFFYFKSVYEEQLLLQKFTGYKNYKSKTGRFLPGRFV